ncbi:MAG: hypothetical protein EOO65_01200 [Methanosarcinales archaeon]|nr:MAG: hypothetical protein EOO65_01200 [Methanosarcinales archaeon]
MDKYFEYEEFIEARLKPLLSSQQSKLSACEDDVTEWTALQTQLQHMQSDAARPVKLLTDVGAGYRMHARLDDVEPVFIDVGAGVFVEMVLPEALRFISAKLNQLLKYDPAHVRAPINSCQ